MSKGQIFLSYASGDRGRVQAMVRALEAMGWAVWWDRTIPPGKNFDDVIEEALDASRCVIVVWSRTSVQSQWVKTEAAEAKRRGILVPVMIDDIMAPLEFRRIQAARLIDWDGSRGDPEFVRLTQAVANVLGELGLPVELEGASARASTQPDSSAAEAALRVEEDAAQARAAAEVAAKRAQAEARLAEEAQRARDAEERAREARRIAEEESRAAEAARKAAEAAAAARVKASAEAQEEARRIAEETARIRAEAEARAAEELRLAREAEEQAKAARLRAEEERERAAVPPPPAAPASTARARRLPVGAAIAAGVAALGLIAWLAGREPPKERPPATAESPKPAATEAAAPAAAAPATEPAARPAVPEAPVRREPERVAEKAPPAPAGSVPVPPAQQPVDTRELSIEVDAALAAVPDLAKAVRRMTALGAEKDVAAREELAALRRAIEEARRSTPRGDRRLAREHNQKALDHLKEGRNADAVVELRLAAKADPADQEVADNLGYALLRAGELETARRQLLLALTLAPGRSSAWASLGQVYARQSRPERAVACFGNAFRFSRDVPQTLRFLRQLAEESEHEPVRDAAGRALQLDFVAGAS